MVASGKTVLGPSGCLPRSTVGICVVPSRLQRAWRIALRIQNETDINQLLRICSH